MDRMTFIGQSSQGKPLLADDIIKYFDHAMAAYEVVQGVDDMSVVDGTPDDIHSSLKLTIQSSYLLELNDVVNYINNTLQNKKDIYGKSFYIAATIHGENVELSVYENTR